MRAPAESISAIVCCYTRDRFALLMRAVESLRVQSSPVAEIILVVDHNTELYAALCDQGAGMIVVENDGPQGLSGARNTGTRIATGTVVAFLDDDACVDRDWAKYVLDAYGDDAIIAVGGQVVPDFECGRPAWFPPELDWVVGCTYTGHRRDAGPVRNLIGANMSFRTEVLRRLDGFSSDLGRTRLPGGGCEETELCIRAQRGSSATIWYEPRAQAHHFVPRDRTTFAYLRRRCVAEGRSKAVVAELVGRDAGLSSERGYVFRTMAAAARRELRDAMLLRRAAWRRLGLVVAAPLLAAYGYCTGRLRLR